MIALLPVLALAMPVPAIVPRPGELRTFRDWTVGCDNGGTCKMASLVTDDATYPTVTASVARTAGPDGRWTITLAGDKADPNAVSVDGRTIAGGSDRYADAEAAAIVAAMAKGRALVALDTGRTPMATISLAGAAAALRYIDAMQGRVGTRSAAVAKGAKPASAVPPAPALPVVAALRPSGTAVTPTRAQLAEMRRLGDCDTAGFAGSDVPESHAIGGGATLVCAPCSSGAYNLIYALFVLKDGTLSPARADVPSGFGEGTAIDAPAQIVNGSFDKGLVESYAKGRGLGDCGLSQSFAWDGTRLRLVEQAQMGECRGNTDLITTWRARVTRR
ncbi:MAG: DUF1176 domain-containing protein [Pseudomonadota bacterium]